MTERCEQGGPETVMSNSAESESRTVRERIAVLEERMEREQKSFLKKAGAVGGILALMISLIIGSFTIYEKFVVEPAKKRESLITEMQEIVSRLGAINSKLVEVQLDGNVSKLAALSANANTAKFVLLDRADTIVSDLNYGFGVGHYITLAYEHLNFGQSKMALFYANSAYEAAKNPLLKVEALRYRGRALFLDGEVQEPEAARQSFREGLKLSSTITGFQATQVMAIVFGDWISSELFFGDCEAAPRILNDMRSQLQSRQAPPNLIVTILGQARMAAANQSRCDAAFLF